MPRPHDVSRSQFFRRSGRVPVWAIVTLCLLLVVGGAVLAGYRIVVNAANGITDAYAALQVKDALIQFMKTNGGRWPKDWDELRPAFDVVTKSGEDFCTFDMVRQRVLVDFALTPEELARRAQKHRAGEQTFLRLPSGRKVIWGDAEMNDFLARYLTPPEK
jgi:hypothetical protein